VNELRRATTGGLLTDLYELNMAVSYLRRGIAEPATFSLLVRDLPPERGFLVAAGLEACLDTLETFGLDAQDQAFLRDTLGFDRSDVDALAGLRFSGEVWAVPEGRVVFAGEPLLEVTAPPAEAQLVETILLNHVTFATAVASKAARCRIAAEGRQLVDFSFRRTQGLDAAMTVARSSAIAGFAATSNVEAARRFGLVAAGTMAHSFVEAFASEEEAFRAFAEDHPTRCTFLVDTYDTLRGVETATRVIRDLGLTKGVAIRLDSGDLGGLARQARALLDAAGLPEVGIFASGGLDELAVDDLVRSGAPINGFGVGTQLGVSADAPSLDTVYKLVQLGDRPVMKLSAGKVSAPGRKQVFRGEGMADVIGLRDQPPPSGTGPLLEPVMFHGRRYRHPDALGAISARFADDLAKLPASARDLRSPVAPMPSVSDEARELDERVRAGLIRP
jgi:nicotinate phosphoribosyltransferase